jgi:hypothetical protein
MLAQATPALDKQEATFIRAYSSFKEGKAVCEWQASDKEQVAGSYSSLGFPYDEIVEVEVICDAGEQWGWAHAICE